MKRSGLVVVVLALGAIVALQGRALALPCPAGCGGQKQACVQTLRVARLACKQDCRTTSVPTGLGTCLGACAASFRAAKASCRSELMACLDTCTVPPPGSCLGTCGQDLGTCARDVATRTRSCAGGCASAADRATCLGGCAAAAREGVASCASGFRTCREHCAGSPGGAFVDQHGQPVRDG